MKKILVFLGLVLLIASIGYCAPVTIIDPAGQSSAEVADGGLRGPHSKAMARQTGSGQFYSGSCRIQSVTIYSATAGDMVGIYDYSDANKSGTDVTVYDIRDMEFELAISANTSSFYADLKGAKFSYGVLLLATNANSVISVVFDY